MSPHDIDVPGVVGFCGAAPRPLDDEACIQTRRVTTDMDPTLVNGLFALAGTLVGALATGLAAWINGRMQDRRHLREIAVSLAMESWRYRKEKFEHLGYVPPLENHLVYSALMADLVGQGNLTPDLVRKRLAEIAAVVDELADHFYRRSSQD